MNEVAFGPFIVSLTERRLWCDGVRVSLKAREAELLGLLVEHRHRVIAKDELIESLWGGAATDAALAQTVCRLRRTLSHFGATRDVIRTVAGIGFQFAGGACAPCGEHVDVLSPEFASYQLALEDYRQRTQVSIQNAIRALEKLQALHPRFVPALVTLARAYTVMGIRGFLDPKRSYLQARRAIDSILDDDPRSADAYATLALLLLFYDRDLEQARLMSQHASALAPHSSFARKSAFWNHVAYRDFSGALAHANHLLQSAPASAQATALLATALYMCERYDEARHRFDMALELDPLNCTALYYATSTCIALEDYKEASRLRSRAASHGVWRYAIHLQALLRNEKTTTMRLADTRRVSCCSDTNGRT